MPAARTSASVKGLDTVLVILALGLGTAMNLFTFAVLYDALFSEQPGLSENATQILTGWGGGIIGIIGAAVGYRVRAAEPATVQQLPPTTDVRQAYD